MGNGAQKNAQNSHDVNFSTKVFMSNSIFLKKQPEQKTTDSPPKRKEQKALTDELSSQLKTLTDFNIFDKLKNGQKLATVVDFSQFIYPNQNIELILGINIKIRELTEKMSLAGLISPAFAKKYADIVKKIEKSFRNKQNMIDFSNEMNRKRLISVMKLLICTLNSARFFKEEVIFSEGKWWKMKDEQFLQGLERKISIKCEAILENYENTDEEDESFANSTSVDEKANRKSNMEPTDPIHDRKSKNPSILRNNNGTEKKSTFSAAISPNIVIKGETYTKSEEGLKENKELNIEKNEKDEKDEKKALEKKTICMEKEEKIHEKNREKSCEIPQKIEDKIVETRRTSVFNKNKGQGSPKKMKYTREAIEKDFMSEIRDFKENIKALLKEPLIPPEDEELRLFIRKYLEKAYENVCEI